MLLLDDPHQPQRRSTHRHGTRRNSANKYQGSDSGVTPLSHGVSAEMNGGGGGLGGDFGGRVLTAEAEGGEDQVGERSLHMREEEGEGQAAAPVLAAAETILRVTGGNV